MGQVFENMEALAFEACSGNYKCLFSWSTKYEGAHRSISAGSVERNTNISIYENTL